MSEIKRALEILRAHTVPENCNAVTQLRAALLHELKYWGADWLHQIERADSRLYHTQRADVHWKSAMEQFEEEGIK